MFCLLVVLVKLSVPAKWLARKTPPRKPLRGKEIISTKPRQKSVYDFLGLLYCFIVLLLCCICLVYCPYVIYFPTFMAWYNLFVLKVPLNPKQTNKQTKHWRQISSDKMWRCWMLRAGWNADWRFHLLRHMSGHLLLSAGAHLLFPDERTSLHELRSSRVVGRPSSTSPCPAFEVPLCSHR